MQSLLRVVLCAYFILQPFLYLDASHPSHAARIMLQDVSCWTDEREIAPP